MTPDELNVITAQIHEELLDATELLAASYASVLRGAGRHMARRMRSQSLALVAAAPFVPPDGDEVLPGDIPRQIERATGKARKDLMRRLVNAYTEHEVPLDVRHPLVSPELLDKVGTRASLAVEEGLRDTYQGVIQVAAEHGFSIPRTASTIVSEIDGVSDVRATALARTDLNGLMNGASHAAATQAFSDREDVSKIWLATEDERTRDTHAEADGQEVPINQFFSVGEDSLMYPGDPDGSDEEVINCRCTLIYSGQQAAEEAIAASSVDQSVLSDAYPPDMDTPQATTAAVTITVEDDAATSAAEESNRTPWEGILAIEGHATSDGRYLIPGEIGNRDLPLPFAASHEKQRATETSGRIEALTWIPQAEFDKEGFELPEGISDRAVVIWGEGSFSANEAGQQALDELENGVGVSLDLPKDREAFIDATTLEEVPPEVALKDADPFMLLTGGVPEGYLHGIAGKIGGVSLASIAAFEETTIRIVGDRAIVASGFAIRESERRCGDGRYEMAEPMTLTASVDPPLMPPREWFFREEPDEPTPITIEPSGEVYGHLALWNTCHAGRANGAYSACMFAPHSRGNYQQFHLGSVLCDDGSQVPIGRITIGTGHAPLNLSAAAARAHYDNTGTVVAMARAKDGVFGIWVSGVIKSDATPEQIRDFRMCPPSGDWRIHDGSLELQAALAVNVAGFPVPRSQLSLSASAESLEIETLILSAPNEEDRAEALRAEYDLQMAEDVDMLVELGVGEVFGIELAALGRVEFRDYSAEERRRMARSGEALPDGSFPIANCTDARNAIQAQGRASASQGRVESHIRKRVSSLGCSGSIFDPYK